MGIFDGFINFLTESGKKEGLRLWDDKKSVGNIIKKKNKSKFYLLLVIIISVFFTSCTQDSKVKNVVNEYVEKNFNDPSSYELIKLKLLDTIFDQRICQYLTNERLAKIDKINKYIKRKQKENSEIALNSLFSGNRYTLISQMSKLEKEEVIMKKYEKDTVKFIRNEINKIKKHSTSKNICYYRYIHEYRTKNDVGALVKYEDTLILKKDLTLIIDFQEYIIEKFGVKFYNE